MLCRLLRSRGGCKSHKMHSFHTTRNIMGSPLPLWPLWMGISIIGSGGRWFQYIILDILLASLFSKENGLKGGIQRHSLTDVCVWSFDMIFSKVIFTWQTLYWYQNEDNHWCPTYFVGSKETTTISIFLPLPTECVVQFRDYYKLECGHAGIINQKCNANRLYIHNKHCCYLCFFIRAVQRLYIRWDI